MSSQARFSELSGRWSAAGRRLAGLAAPRSAANSGISANYAVVARGNRRQARFAGVRWILGRRRRPAGSRAPAAALRSRRRRVARVASRQATRSSSEVLGRAARSDAAGNFLGKTAFPSGWQAPERFLWTLALQTLQRRPSRGGSSSGRRHPVAGHRKTSGLTLPDRRHAVATDLTRRRPSRRMLCPRSILLSYLAAGFATARRPERFHFARAPSNLTFPRHPAERRSLFGKMRRSRFCRNHGNFVIGFRVIFGT